jgi:hypothetical protein
MLQCCWEMLEILPLPNLKIHAGAVQRNSVRVWKYSLKDGHGKRCGHVEQTGFTGKCVSTDKLPERDHVQGRPVSVGGIVVRAF